MEDKKQLIADIGHAAYAFNIGADHLDGYERICHLHEEAILMAQKLSGIAEGLKLGEELDKNKEDKHMNGNLYEKLAKENGEFWDNGKHYVQIQQAHIDGPADEPDEQYYTALALCTTDTADEDGTAPCYEVRWGILDSARESWAAGDTDESDACDWDSPYSVRVSGGYNLEGGYTC